MKNSRQGIRKFGKYLLAVIAFAVLFSVCSVAADDFDATLEQFPESYRPYLEELHKKYPQWVFVPFETGLDWNESVKAQYGNEALVQHSISADILKSHDADDYNPSTGTFVSKDAGFVQASELAVEYFLDPRNFLNEDGIFQFEMLSFSEIFTIDAVELILKGSFMHQAKIEYLDREGTAVKTERTYAEVIYEAGKTYNINPCYLASKILNEVGSDGSYSVWGNHPDYPGIYNFYNIGATDGVNAITRGLAWANGGENGTLTTYSRPWNSPEKSIMGGAEFLASSYIAVGQFTGYLQRFNVNPNSYYPVHTHQFMTNLSGALSQGYTSYASYAKLGILENQFVFSIPVFKNMCESTASDTLTTVDSKIQYGTVNVNGVNVRTGPSTTYARLQTSSGANILLSKDTEVKIQSKHFVDSSYYARVLQYPVWYKIKFTYNSVSYTGYILSDYVDIKSVTNVGIGTYDLGIFKTSADTGGKLMTSNPAICKIIDDDTVQFLSEGEVYVTVYNSRGLCDRIKFKVCPDISKYTVPDITVTSDETTITVSLPKSNTAERYGYYLRDEEGKFIKGGDITYDTYTFKNLSKGSKYTVYCRYVNSYCYDNGPLKSVEIVTKEQLVPDAPEDLTIDNLTTTGYTFSWQSKGADGYRVYRYQPELSKYIVYGDFKVNSITVADLSPGYACAYRIKAYKLVDGKRVYSDYSELYWTLTPTLAVSDLQTLAVSDREITLDWSDVENATAYKLYIKDSNSDRLIYEGTETSFVFNEAMPSTEYSFYAVATVTKRGLTSESEPSDTLNVLTTVGVVDNFKASDVTANSYTISWDAIDSADFYTVYRLEDGEYIKLISITTPYYTFENLENSAKSFYKVSATYRLGSIIQESELSQEFSATTLPDTLVNVSGVPYQDKVVLTWDKVKNADCYNVYLLENGKYVLKATVKDNTYTLKGLDDVTKYTVRVRGYIRSTLGTQKGKLCTYSFYTMAKSITSITASSVTDTSYTLSWDASSEGVNTYYVYRYDESKPGFKRIATTTKPSIKLTGLEPGTTHDYRIIPHIIKNGSSFLRGYTSATFSFSTNLGKTVNLKASSITSNSFTLSWAPTENASYYRVYRYDTSTKEYILISSTRNTSLKISSLSGGKKYYYKVRAIGNYDGKYYYGYYSDLFTVTTKK